MFRDLCLTCSLTCVLHVFREEWFRQTTKAFCLSHFSRNMFPTIAKLQFHAELDHISKKTVKTDMGINSEENCSRQEDALPTYT